MKVQLNFLGALFNILKPKFLIYYYFGKCCIFSALFNSTSSVCRVLELEMQNSALSTQLERQRKQDDSFIDSMRLNLSNLEQALVAERAEHQNTR